MRGTQLGLLAVAFLFAATGLVIFVRRPTHRRHALGLLVALATALWPLSLFMISHGAPPGEATFWTRMAFAGPSASLWLYILVAREYIREPGERWLTPGIIGASFLFLTAEVGAFHPRVVEWVRPGLDGPSFEYGTLYPMVILAMGLLGVWAFHDHRAVCRKLEGRQKIQGQILLASATISSIPTLVTNVVLPILGHSEFFALGPLWFLFALSAIYYSMGRHRLFDIEIGLGPILNTPRYAFHQRIRQSLCDPEVYLNLGALSRSLQKAFEFPNLKLALLDPEGRPTHEFGHPGTPIPRPELLFFRNGPVVTENEVPEALRTVLREQEISALLRLGADPNRPKAVLSFGKGFHTIMYSTQDFSLLRTLVRRLNLALEIAEASRKAVESASQSHPLPQPPEPRPDPFELRRAGPANVLLFDPGSTYKSLIEAAPIRDLELHRVGTTDECVAKAKENRFDLCLIAADAAGTDVKTTLDRIARENPKCPILLLEGVDSQVPPVEPLRGARQVLGAHRLRSADPDHTARLLQSALLAGRYARGEIDLNAVKESAEAREKLFPLLIASLSEAKDFTGMSRLFQRRLLEYTLKNSKTNVEAARKLGLSPPNLSLKLTYYKMEERAGGVKRTPSPRSSN